MNTELLVPILLRRHIVSKATQMPTDLDHDFGVIEDGCIEGHPTTWITRQRSYKTHDSVENCPALHFMAL